jgi:hypothetical protein
MHIPIWFRIPALLALGVFFSASLAAQDAGSTRPEPTSEPTSQPRLRVFLDCERGCDRNYFLTTLPFVLFTQDRLDADIHALITGLNTAAGGREYTISLLGRGMFVGRADTLRANIPPNSTDDMRRREIGRVLQIGLVPYAVRVSGPEQFSVRYDAPAGSSSGSSMISDPWDFWVYRIRANGSGSAEQLNSSYQLTGGVNISRTTEIWKVSLNTNEEYRANTFTLSSGEDRNFILHSSDVSARLVRSVTQHWSIGARGTGGRSDFRNQSLYGGFEISGEYNVFPWKEATSRQLVALVAVGARHFDYQDTTIFGRRSETRPIARAIVAAESRQQWGTIDAALRYTQFLHDAAIHNVSFDGRAQIRLTRGLSLELRGEAAKVNDQIFLRRGGASDEDVLLRQRALATNFRIGGSVGLSFTFGSIYNTIVNPRLDELGT